MAKGRLGAADLVAGQITALYTVPVGFFAAGCIVRFANRSGGPFKARLAIGAGIQPQQQDWLDYDPSVVVVEDNGLVIGPGETVWLQSDTSLITVSITGEEIANGNPNHYTPAFDFDFQKNRAIDPRLTVQRAGNAWYFDQDGVLKLAAPNTARRSRDPVTGLTGLLIERSTTNQIRNNTCSGAVAGSPGVYPTHWGEFTNVSGLTRKIVATGVEAGVNYVDIRLSGTPSIAGFFDVHLDVGRPAIVSGSTYTLSIFTKIVAGSLSGVTSASIALHYLSSSNQNFQDQETSSLEDILLISSITRKIDYPLVNSALPFFRLTFSVQPVDVTVRLAIPQFEQGFNASSPILTSGATTLRAADVPTISLGSWFNPAEGTLVIEYDSIGAQPLAYIAAAQKDGSNSDFIALRTGTVLGGAGGGSNDFVITARGVNQADTGGVAAVPGVVYRAALGFASNDCAMSTNGSVIFSDKSVTLPVMATLALGNVGSFTAEQLAGRIYRVTYYAKRLPDTVLQSISRDGIPSGTGRLGSADIPAGVDTLLFNVPAGQFISGNLRFCNRTSTQKMVQISIGTGSAPTTMDDYTGPTALPANGIVEVQSLLAGGDFNVWARTEIPGVSARLHGFLTAN
jgi:hypothetical protein